MDRLDGVKLPGIKTYTVENGDYGRCFYCHIILMSCSLKTMQTKLPVIVDEHPGIIIFFTSGGNPFDILQ